MHMHTLIIYRDVSISLAWMLQENMVEQTEYISAQAERIFPAIYKTNAGPDQTANLRRRLSRANVSHHMQI